MIVNTADFHINISNRPDDTIKSLDQIANIANGSQRLVIVGDIYHKRCPTPTEMNIFRDFIKKIKVPTDIVIGNHDKNLEATTLDEFYKFKLPNVTLHKAPYILEIEGTKIYYDHRLVEGAKLGSSDFELTGKAVLPLVELVKNNCDFYVFGDVHKPQMIRKVPPILYTGSIERIDFGERLDDKYVFLINPKTKEFGYKKLSIRPMVQWDIDLSKEEDKYPIVADAITKVIIKGTKEQIEKFNEGQLKEFLVKNNAYTFRVVYNIVRQDKVRNKEINESKSVVDCFKEYANQNKFDDYTTQKGLEILK
jgi:DNA repair exonuclease SbcCD nuclease subunit